MKTEAVVYTGWRNCNEVGELAFQNTELSSDPGIAIVNFDIVCNEPHYYSCKQSCLVIALI